MNIVVYGAGAIGSLFGGLLAIHHEVTLVGRPEHVQAINEKGLHIRGCTNLDNPIQAVESIENLQATPDLILLTVKSYDTKEAAENLCTLVKKKTYILSLQNGLDNIPTLNRFFSSSQILGGVTAYGAMMQKPGWIQHTGVGYTIIGQQSKSRSKAKKIATLFNNSGISTTVTTKLNAELWKKAIINTCINPLTAILQCYNGYLLENPILEPNISVICQEATQVASKEGMKFSQQSMLEATKEVIRNTANNQSSMLQSILQKKPTEIDFITGVIVNKGEQQGTDVSLNKILLQLVHDLEKP